MSVASANTVDAAIKAALESVTTGNGYALTLTVYPGVTGRNLADTALTFPACGFAWESDTVQQARDKARIHQREYSVEILLDSADANIQSDANAAYFACLDALGIGDQRELGGVCQFTQLTDLTVTVAAVLTPRVEGSQYTALALAFAVTYKALRS